MVNGIEDSTSVPHSQLVFSETTTTLDRVYHVSTGGGTSNDLRYLRLQRKGCGRNSFETKYLGLPL